MSYATLQSAVSLPREHLAAIQHIFNDALAVQARAARPPPPPYHHPLQPHRDSSVAWFKPRMDLFESHSGSGARPLITATFELPGLRKEDVHIDVLDNHMIVAGDRRQLPNAVTGSMAAAHVTSSAQDEEMRDGEGVAATAATTAAAVGSTAMTGGSGKEEDTRVSAMSYQPREGYTVREIKRGRFKRVVPLPAGTKFEDVKASMHDGILTVTFPGSERPVPHNIPVA